MRKVFFKSILTSISLIYFISVDAQGNNDPAKGAIDAALPRSPESASFERYGNIPMNEYSGVPNISIPLYNLKGRFIDVPISLSYNASGIKVSQEATCVGLGFDLIAGGRITVETRGSVDQPIVSPPGNTFISGFTRLMEKYNNSFANPDPYHPLTNAPIYGYAHPDMGSMFDEIYPGYHADMHTGDPLWDDPWMLGRCAWEGDGEPDLYHANFLGHSITFLEDIVDHTIHIEGEAENLKISISRQQNGLLSGITITDEKGIRYIFEELESSSHKFPISGANIFYADMGGVSALLLSRIEKLDEIISFEYEHYGTVRPCVPISQSVNGTSQIIHDEFNTPTLDLIHPTPDMVDILSTEPHYLKQIITENNIVNFSLGSRIDLDGEGGRKVENLEIFDQDGNSLKTFDFTYEYFYSSTNALPDYKTKRLKLLSITDEAIPEAPWKFSYVASVGPAKNSFAQDHWGYFNGSQFNTSLIPSLASLGSLFNDGGSFLLYNRHFDYYNGVVTNVFLDPNGMETWYLDAQKNAYRSCVSDASQVYTLSDIVYPTGGQTHFEYEPHTVEFFSTIYGFKGGGLRVKSIKNFAFNDKLESEVEYDYRNSGVYLGQIEYKRIATKAPSGNSVGFSSAGDLSFGQVVGYREVKTTLKDYSKTSNSGATIKYFQVNQPPSFKPSSILEPYHNYNIQVPGLPYDPAIASMASEDQSYIFPQWSGIPLRPALNLDGKLLKEEIYDNNQNLIKTVEHNYEQQDQTFELHHLRVIDNYEGMVTLWQPSQWCYNCIGDGGWGWAKPTHFRRFTIYLFPSISFYTRELSTITKTYDGGQELEQKQEFIYNSKHQLEETVTYNSDGSKIINKTLWPANYDLSELHSNSPNNPYSEVSAPEAHSVAQMIIDNDISNPIEVINLKGDQNGNRYVTSAIYNRYRNGELRDIEKIQLSQPLQVDQYFSYSHVEEVNPGTHEIVRNGSYKPEYSAKYDSKKHLIYVESKAAKKAFVWDGNDMVAEIINAKPEVVSYTSFEHLPDNNGWFVNSLAEIANDAVMGEKVYDLKQGSVYSKSLDASQQYVVSFWRTEDPVTVSGSSTHKSTAAINGWIYEEHIVTSSSVVTISGLARIDELRLYPESATMSTAAITKFGAMSASCDPNNRITRYEYDEAQRLSTVRDYRGNILQHYEYEYHNGNEFAYGNDEMISTAIPDCQVGYESLFFEPYKVEKGRYGSMLSKADANAKAQEDIDAHGQAWANAHATCVPYVRWQPCCGWSSSAANFELHDNIVSFTITIYGGNSVGHIGNIEGPLYFPSQTRQVNTTYLNNSYQVIINSDGTVSMYGSINGSSITLTGTYQL